jgi:SulP family sulfate permease
VVNLRRLFRRDTAGKDAVSGLVLGVESVPDSLASGLLAGVNPIFGLYGAMWGTFTGALFTSSAFMAVQTTGAMSIIVADVDQIGNADDPTSALFTLSIMTGVVMLTLGLLKLGMLLNYVSQSVMIGFISAVGVNIVLGQLDGFTGYDSEGANRVSRAIDLVLHPFDIDPATIAVGASTIVLILVLERTRLDALGMVVAVFAASAMVPAFGWDVERLQDIADIPNSLPLPKLPDLGLLPSLLVPALALAFIGLVQGAGVSASFPRPDGTPPDTSRDFVGQGAANIAAGTLQGMPVGGSMSASALAVSGGARSRLAVLIAGVVMGVVILVFAKPVGYIAMPALAGLLIIVGVRTIKPGQIATVLRTGRIQQTVLLVTFVLTMLIPLQFAVLIGVGASMMLYVIRQSNQISLQRLRVDDERHLLDDDPPDELPADTVVLLEPVGSLFFAAAPAFEAMLPTVTDQSSNSVVVIRLRGRDDVGATLIEVFVRYASALHDVESKLVLASVQPRVQDQLKATGMMNDLGEHNIYGPGRWRTDTLLTAYDDANAWVARTADDRTD